LNLTLLLDLDDTLLVNSIDTFLPVYLQALSKELAPYADPKRLVSQLLKATRQMILNQRPDCTLKDVFDENFYPALQIDPQEVRPTIERFYAERFPRLASLTEARPEAVRLVEEGFSRGYRIVVATNPLFPRTAILQRLEWAGLSPQKYPFDLITSYETFHFAKPNPAFYAEVMARLGWPEGPALMVGNDLENDILPARQLGLPAYWLDHSGQAPGEGTLDPSAHHSLNQVIPWIEQQPEAELQPDYTTPDAMLAILRSTPATLRVFCSDLDMVAWQQRPQPDEWCPTEILCHLRDVEREVNLFRIQKVLEEEMPFLPGKDTDVWAEQRQYLRQSGPQALESFTTSRMQLIGRLEGLPEEAWQRSARHAIFGPTTLLELVRIIAGHDRLHIQQFLQDLQANSKD
jgi:FMN phosphatase YigB (HAD superfamily)